MYRSSAKDLPGSDGLKGSEAVGSNTLPLTPFSSGSVVPSKAELVAHDKVDPGTNVNAGAQLKGVEQHSGMAAPLGNKEEAGIGFDTSGRESGNLVYPDKNKYRQIPPTALDKQIPSGARDDPQIKQMQAWYRSLDAQKAEKDKQITEIKEQQKTSRDPLFDVKLTTLSNDVKRLTDDQAKAQETVSVRVEEIRREKVDKGLEFDEEPITNQPSAKKGDEPKPNIPSKQKKE